MSSCRIWINPGEYWVMDEGNETVFSETLIADDFMEAKLELSD